MRRFATLATAVVASLAIAVPTATTASATTSTAAPSASAATATAAPAAAAESFKPKKGKKAKLKLKKKFKGVQPGLGLQKITVKGLKGKGKVKFTLKGAGLKKNKKVKVKKGKAVYKAPALGTGDYKVIAKYAGKKGTAKFRVYNSAVFLNATSFTFSKSTFASYPTLSGSVTFKDKAASGGFFDVYLNGNRAGGSGSPDYLRFASVDEAGNFNFSTGFASSIASKYAPGTYTFQGFYTETASFAEYIASNFITVVVTP